MLSSKVSRSLLFSLVFICAACSYSHGVKRVLTLENEINDLTCISSALENMGFETRMRNKINMDYVATTKPKTEGFSIVITAPNTLTHRRDYGSAPQSCKTVKPFAKLMEKNEVKFLEVCGLNLSRKPTEEIKCHWR